MSSLPQPRLFYDGFEDAAREVIGVCGGPKVVGSALWPAKSPDAARTRLLDCLNHERAEKLSPDEIILLAKMGRERACHAIVSFLMQELGYAPPVPIDPEDEKAELQRQFHEDVERLHHLAARIARRPR
jgi:hypothetical protein